MSGLIKLHHSGNPAHLSTNLFERPHMGRQIQFVLSRGKMTFKYVESKVISYVSDRDPEQTPWEKNYPGNCKQSGCQRTGNLCCNQSIARPHRTPSCPGLGHGVLCLKQIPRSKGWPEHLPSGTPPACLLETGSLTIFWLGWVTMAWRTQICPREPAWPEQVGGEGWGERERSGFHCFLKPSGHWFY